MKVECACIVTSQELIYYVQNVVKMGIVIYKIYTCFIRCRELRKSGISENAWAIEEIPELPRQLQKLQAFPEMPRQLGKLLIFTFLF